VFEDAFTYKPAYAILWPISTQKSGIGIMKETLTLFGIDGSTVLAVGMTLLIGALLVRTHVEGTVGWWRVFFKRGTGEPLVFFKIAR
jgi:hypothetical protein